MSLRARLVFGSLAVLVVAVGIADLSAWLALDRHLSARTDDALRTAERRIEATPVDREVRLGPNALSSLVPTGLAAVLLDDEGRVLLATAPAGGAFPGSDPARQIDPSTIPPGRIVDAPGGAHGDQRCLRVPVPVTATVAAGGENTDETRAVSSVLLIADTSANAEATAALLRTELVVSALIVAVWAVAAWTAVGIGLRPLRSMAAAARRMANGSSDTLPYADSGNETGALAAALNEAFAVRAEAVEATRSFLADASHELKTPIAAIAAWAELYRVGGLLGDDAVAESMNAIEADAARMHVLVEQMLELARLEGSGLASTEPVDVAAVVASVVAAVGSSDRVEVDAASDAAIQGDPVQLRSIAQNLVENAVVHAGPMARILVTVTADVREVHVEVRDDGPGLSPEELARAFDRFWRADRSRSVRGGTGLGLPIVAEAVRRHGGTITLETLTPHGFRAHVALPRA